MPNAKCQMPNGLSLKPSNPTSLHFFFLITKLEKENLIPTSLTLKAMFHSSVFFLFFTFLLLATIPVFIANPDLPDPEPVSVQSQTLSTPSAPATIPAFPEQSDIAACPLDLTEELFRGIKSACGSNDYSGPLHRTRCCPVLAAWLYSAYSTTALHRATTKIPKTTTFDMPVLPDDSETCVDSLEKALGNKGIELVKPNQTCDVVYCYCGIRLHPLSCPEAFSVNSHGKLVGHQSVKRLETDCLSSSANGYSSLARCSKCLNSLYMVRFLTPSVFFWDLWRGNEVKFLKCG